MPHDAPEILKRAMNTLIQGWQCHLVIIALIIISILSVSRCVLEVGYDNGVQSARSSYTDNTA